MTRFVAVLTACFALSIPTSAFAQTYCGDSTCDPDEDPSWCPEDCGEPEYCGDFTCSESEDEWSCPEDCGEPEYCGDFTCNDSEDEWSCPEDCGEPEYCGDFTCNDGEDEWSCPSDCGEPEYCGDFTCNDSEDEWSCPEDCGYPEYCGDSICNDGEDYDTCPEDCPPEDADGDGYYPPEDCDDYDANVHPDAPEICDEIDNDCDGEIDEDEPLSGSAWYYDGDGDGYGDDSNVQYFCSAPGEEWVSQGGDCDDSNGDVHPGATEVCDGVDNDCDGLIDDDDDDVTGTTTWYYDGDGDGYGDDISPVDACYPPDSYYVDQGGDCRDDDPEIHPAALEWCDEIDNDCDTYIDEDDDDVVDATLYYWDEDDDGYGDDANTTLSCDSPDEPEWVDQGGDCDDSKPYIWPGAQEYCDPLDEDEDCDGTAEDDDPDSLLKTQWWDDNDLDGYGDEDDMNPRLACDGEIDEDDNNRDCDDDDGNINPGKPEICDPDDTDENCNGLADNLDPTLSDGTDYYADNDGDTYGDPDNVENCCELPPGHVEDNTDCNDNNEDVHPGAEEVCNGIDDDCDDLIDDDDPSVTGRPSWGYDRDSDSYPDHLSAEPSCLPVPDKIRIGITPHDCADLFAGINPGALEICNGIDEDCDLEVDEDFDQDEDDWATCFGDCDDEDPDTHPEAEEVCDDVDNDCNDDLDLEGCLGGDCGDGELQLEFGEPIDACQAGNLVLQYGDLEPGESVRSDGQVTLEGSWPLNGDDLVVHAGCDVVVNGTLDGAGVVFLGAGDEVRIKGTLNADTAVLRAARRVRVHDTGWVLADVLELEAPTTLLQGDVDTGVSGCSEADLIHQHASGRWTASGPIHLDGGVVTLRGLVTGTDAASVVSEGRVNLQTTSSLEGFSDVQIIAGDRLLLKGSVSDLGSLDVTADNVFLHRNGVVEQVGSLDVDLSTTSATYWQGDVLQCGDVTVSADDLRLNWRTLFDGNGSVTLEAGYLNLAADFVDNGDITLDTDTWQLRRAASFVGNASCTISGNQLNNRSVVGCTEVP